MTGRSNQRDDVEYFRTRALQEQLAATNAQSPEARKCHDELAMMYRFKTVMLSTCPDSWAVSLLEKGSRRPPERKYMVAPFLKENS